MPSTSVYGFRYQSLSDPPDGAALGQDLAEDVEAALQGNLTLGAGLTVPAALAVGGNATVTGSLTVGGVNIGSVLGAIHTAGINNATAGDTTTSATFVNIAATSSFSFTKDIAATALKIDFHKTLFVSGAGSTVVEYAVQIGGTDYVVCRFYHNNTLVHAQASGVRIISGIGAGALTVQARWRRVSGTGTLTTDTSDWLSIACTEIPV